MNNNKNLYAKLIPVMLCFFAMGFVDLGYYFQLCQGRLEPDGCAGQYLSVAGFLLVPYLLGSHRNIDE